MLVLVHFSQDAFESCIARWRKRQEQGKARKKSPQHRHPMEQTTEGKNTS
jgi:hypothetical protein